ncbi:MAG: hypothetical protein ACRD2J_10935 [Thermoanaerobaculia bacterium]
MAFLVALHSWLRWAVLLFGIAALVATLVRRDGKATVAERLSLFFIISLDLQFLLGLALWAIGPWLRGLIYAPGSVMGNDVSRFFALEHGVLMFAAVAAAHIGRALGRKAATPDRARRRVAIGFAVSLLLMLAGIPWPAFEHGRPLFRL